MKGNKFYFYYLLLYTSSVLVSNLRRWNLGLPKKEFLIVVNRDLQWWAPDPAPVWGEPGGVTPTATTAK